jgi:hypothetical protein
MSKQTAVEWLIEKLEEPILKLSWYKEYLYEQAKQMEKDHLEISDEEIEKAAWERYTGDSARLGWIEACKWYREQLRKTSAEQE